MNEKLQILFVCLGNICRSPTAEAVFQQKIECNGLIEQIEIDSAGTAAWHSGKSPDSRSILAGKKRGYELSSLRARQVMEEDFFRFDYILAMDEANLEALKDMRPKNAKANPELFLAYCENSPFLEVPDPYYGGDDGFNTVLDLIENASDALLNTLEKRGQISWQ